MHVHRLHADAAWAGEAVEDQLSGTGEDSSAKRLNNGLQPYGWVLIDPSAWLHVDLLPWAEGDFEHVAVAVDPEDALRADTCKGVDEQAGSGEHDVRKTSDPVECVVERLSCSQPLVLANVKRLAPLQVHAKHMPRAVSAESDLARAHRADHHDRHSGDHSFECSGEFLDSNLDLGVLPQQDVVLEVDRHLVKLDMQNWNEFSLNVVNHARKRLVVNRGRFKNRNWHD